MFSFLMNISENLILIYLFKLYKSVSAESEEHMSLQFQGKDFITNYL